MMDTQKCLKIFLKRTEKDKLVLTVSTLIKAPKSKNFANYFKIKAKPQLFIKLTHDGSTE